MKRSKIILILEIISRILLIILFSFMIYFFIGIIGIIGREDDSIMRIKNIYLQIISIILYILPLSLFIILLLISIKDKIRDYKEERLMIEELRIRNEKRLEDIKRRNYENRFK
jgi:hypothetical protein